MQNTWSGQLDARSYLWRPWFGTWDLGATATHVLTEAETDSEVTVVSGDGQLRLFPRSRIPFMAFANVQDTRVGLDADTIGTPDTRITRFGLMQQYKARSGAGDFSINYERSIFDQLDGDLEDQTNDIAKLRAKRKGEDHRVSVDFNLLNSDRLEDDELSWDSIARHGYEPNDQLSLDSSVRVGQADSRVAAGRGSSTQTRLAADSFGMWRHAERPLQLTSKLNLRSTFRSDDDSFSDSFETGSALFGVRYLLTDALNVSGELGYQAKGSSQDKVEHGVRELVAGSYAPGPLDFRSFDYTYSGSLSGQNDSFDTGSSRQGLQGFARHGLSRSRPSNAERPTYLSFDVDQSIGGRADTDERDDFDLTHRAAFSWGRRASAQSTQLRTLFLDTRRLVGIVSDSQSFNLTLSHNHPINAISDWALSTTTSAIRSGKRGTGSRWGDSPYVDVDAEYRHRRLFG
ncbi:MAG: hypothetical protein JRG89_20270, partial [Deltaproteobacteria bacterium]|nr:hypothetical protein [Deltaproteobacteria bacterium]